MSLNGEQHGLQQQDQVSINIETNKNEIKQTQSWFGRMISAICQPSCLISGKHSVVMLCCL